MLRHLATTMRKAKHDMMFISQVRGVGGEGPARGLRGETRFCDSWTGRPHFDPGCLRTWEAGGCIWTSDGDEGRWLGLHVIIGGRAY